MHALTPSEWTLLVLLLMSFAVLLWATPSCGEKTCVDAHRGHMVATRAAAIEKEHATFHDRLRPQPLCSLCQSDKRNDDRRDPS